MAEPIRLQRFLSQCGVAARRKAELLITAGDVQVNGKVVTELGVKVDPEADRVSVRGQDVRPLDHSYILLNKPKGCLTAVSDAQGRPTVMNYLPRMAIPVAPVGRLDFNSEGVLVLTNDGELSAALQAARSHVEKIYHVKLRGRVSAEHLEALRQGVRLDDGTITAPAQVDILAAPSSHQWLVVTLTEGKSRQIRRMAEALGYQVLKLQRVSFAGLTFHGLRVGDARELSQREVDDLRGAAGLDHSPNAASRGSWSARREETDRRRNYRAKQAAAAPAPPETPWTRAPSERQQLGPPGRARFGPAGRPRTAPPGGARPVAVGRPDVPRGRPAGRPGGYTAGRPGGYTAGRPGGYTADRPGGSKAGRPGGAPGGRAGGYTGGRPGGAPGGRPGGYTGGRPGGAPGDRPGGYKAGRPGGAPAGRPRGYAADRPRTAPGGRPGASAPGRPRTPPTGRPRPAGTGGRPRPVSTGGRPRPPSTGGRPRPPSTGGRPRPPSTGGRPRPPSTGGRPRPAGAGGHPRGQGRGGPRR